MAAVVTATLGYRADRREEFERAIEAFVPNLASTLGWKNRRVHWAPEAARCTIEWELASVDDLQRGQQFEQSPDAKPGWYTSMQSLVVGERIDLDDGNATRCLLNTLP